VPIRNGGVGDPLREILRFGADFLGRVDAAHEDVLEGLRLADPVRQGLRMLHDFEVDLPTDTFVVFRVDGGVVIRCGALGAGLPIGGGNVDGADGERVLQHHEHGGVFFVGRGGEVGAEVADVEVEFDLPKIIVREEAVAEDFMFGERGGRELG